MIFVPVFVPSCVSLFLLMVNCRARHLSFWLAFRPLLECIRLGWVPQDCRTATQLGIHAHTPSEKWWNTHNEVRFFCVSQLLPGSFCYWIAPKSIWKDCCFAASDNTFFFPFFSSIWTKITPKIVVVDCTPSENCLSLPGILTRPQAPTQDFNAFL